MSEATNENKALLDAAEKFSHVEPIDLKVNDSDLVSVPVLSVPAGRKIESVKKYVDEYRTRPERKTGASTMDTIASFIDQVNRSKDGDSVIFADVATRTSPKLIAVLDYNKAGAAGDPRFGQHRVVHNFPVSEEWKAWTAKPLENIGLVDFAEFLENRIMDVLDPASLDAEGKGTLAAFCRQLGINLASPQALMELSRGLTVHANHKVVQAINLSTGEVQVSFGETHTDAKGAPVKAAGGFAIAIPVFLNGPAYQIPVRLRYKARDGAVFWTLQPQRLNVIWDDAVTEAVNAVTTKTDLTTLFGRPEA